MREAHGLECAVPSDWSARGLRTGVREAHGLECAMPSDWSARGSRTGVPWSIVPYGHDFKPKGALKGKFLAWRPLLWDWFVQIGFCSNANEQL